jgi:hypothetical protein
MRVVVFTGPTLSVPAGRELLPGATFLPPAACGDVYRAWRGGATIIALVDGRFDQSLSVWHKEILWAISQGVTVLGAASMGALRAAELHELGMIGVGRIFGWFRDGELEDDDEVAVAHGAEADGYATRSVALVNMRVTLARARNQGIVGAETARTLGTLAKDLFYPDRRYETVIGLAADAIGTDERARLSGWLRDGQVDQKRADAVELLSGLRDGTFGAGGVAAPVEFSYTQPWHALRQRIDRAGP